MINIDTHESEIPEGSGKRRSAYRSEIHTYRQERGRTHCQIVPLELPLQIQALRPKLEPEVLGTLGRLCAVHLLPKAPEIGTLVLFSLNDEISVPFTDTISEHERVFDKLSLAGFWLNQQAEREMLRCSDGRITSTDPQMQKFLESIYHRGLIEIISTGTDGMIRCIPVTPGIGMLSDAFSPELLVVNSHFFLMDFSDLSGRYDHMGEPYGLLVIDGQVILPPLYERSALCVHEDLSSSIEQLSIRETTIMIDHRSYRHGENCTIYIRGEHERSPAADGTDLIIINERIAGVRRGGNAQIPQAGYVLHLDHACEPCSHEVSYQMDHPLELGIQVGPALIKDGQRVDGFIDPFYRGEGVPSRRPSTRRIGIPTGLHGSGSA